MKGFSLILVACLCLFAVTPMASQVLQKSQVVATDDSDAVSCWYPGKNLGRLRRANKADGGWYLGKNVGRLFGLSC